MNSNHLLEDEIIEKFNSFDLVVGHNIDFDDDQESFLQDVIIEHPFELINEEYFFSCEGDDGKFTLE